MARPIMNALDALAGSQASAYITLADGNRYCFMQLYSFESKMDISVAEVPILGKSGKGNKLFFQLHLFCTPEHHNFQ